MKKTSIKNLVVASLFLGLGLLLPFLTGQIQSIGNKLLPMHIPIILAGFVCGWPYGLLVGIITPIFRSMLFGMPPMFPVAIAMAFELGTYGFLAGILYKSFPKKNVFLYITLVLSMIGGRIVWGMSSFVLYGLSGMKFTLEIFMAGALINAIPGIILQIIIIPIIIIALKKADVIGKDESWAPKNY